MKRTASRLLVLTGEIKREIHMHSDAYVLADWDHAMLRDAEDHMNDTFPDDDEEEEEEDEDGE